MRRIILIASVGIALSCTNDSVAPGQGFGRGQSAGGGGHVGADAVRAKVSQFATNHATPALGRPSGSGAPNRPAIGGSQGFGGGGTPGLTGARPGGVSRPGAGGGGTQNLSFANLQNQGGARPGIGSGTQNPVLSHLVGQGGARPGAGGGQNPNIANLPAQGGVRPGAGGGGVQNPNLGNLPPQGGVRPGAGGGGVQNPNIANLPAQGGARPGGGGGGVQNPYIAYRPRSDGSRPGANGGGVPPAGIDNTRPIRPNPDRPGGNGGGVPPNWIDNRPNRPINPENRPNRPINPDRPIVNRPDLNIGNRVVQNNINNVNNINVNQWNQYNTQVNANRNWFNSPGNWDRPWYGGRPAWYYSRPWYGFHYDWHSGYWNLGSTLPAFWLGTAATAGFLSSPGDTYVYSNPYYVQPASTTVVVQPALDYSSPIPSPPPDQLPEAIPPQPTVAEDGMLPDVTAEAPPTTTTEDPAVTEANKLFDDARVAFKRGDYANAQGLTEKAIELLPSDATLHEFRALTLFAQQKYKDAAAGLYAVLAAGPGWNWETMSRLYPNPDTYTKQLRTLEAYTRDHPKEADAHFLQAYQYLVLGSKDAAVTQLKEVVRLEPKDTLSAALVKALTPGEGATGGDASRPGGAN